MIPIYQKIVDKGRGDCMRAAVASLLELPYDDVPNFIETDNPHSNMLNFILSKGYELSNGYDFHGCLYNYGIGDEDRKYSTIHILQEDKELIGIKGYFYASVLSPKYFDINKGENRLTQITHAVIIDKNYNIVHDPNPNNKNIISYPLSDKLKYNGILDVYMFNDKI